VTSPGEITRSEIMSQPAIWADVLEEAARQAAWLAEFWDEGTFNQVILTGCGSTYYLSVFGAALLRAHAGIPAYAYPASELMLFPQANFDASRRTLLVTVSRSGATRETIEAARSFRRAGRGETLAVSCHSESRLAAEADHVLAADVARERSRVQTRSFSSMTLLLQVLAGVFSEGEAAVEALMPLPGVLERLLPQFQEVAHHVGTAGGTARYMFLGSGMCYGLACEAMLKMMEMSLLPAMAFHALEFLHGPRYLTDAETTVVALLSDAAQAEEASALEEAQRRGARVLAAGEQVTGRDSPRDHGVSLRSGLPSWVRPVLYLPFLQLLAFYQAQARGKDPDRLGES